MKINRTKRAQKHLQFYCNNFGFREPYQILIDGTFCLHALKNHFQIVNQIQKYFQAEIKPLTTACCIIEAESLGAKFQGTTQLLKEFKVHKCGHEKKPIPGFNCVKSMSTKSRYIIATQDRDLQEWIRNKPGIPLLYLHQVAPTLDAPSETSERKAKKITSKILGVSKLEEEKLTYFKQKEGLAVEIEETKIRRKKFRGGPNPLSCKKKKIKSGQDTSVVSKIKEGKVEKKRKRIKIPKHVKQILNQGNKTLDE